MILRESFAVYLRSLGKKAEQGLIGVKLMSAVAGRSGTSSMARML
jgi:hypothetical protein